VLILKIGSDMILHSDLGFKKSDVGHTLRVSVITKKKWICSAFRWLYFADQNLFSHSLFSIIIIFFLIIGRAIDKIFHQCTS